MSAEQSPEIFTHDRAGFLERLARLAGQSAWREPLGGTGSNLRKLPAEHHLAAALAFARGDNANNIGPELCYAYATQQPVQQERVVRWLTDKMDAGTGAAGKRNRHRMTLLAGAAYKLAMFGRGLNHKKDRDADLLVSVGAGWLATVMEATVARAEQQARG